MGLTIDEWDDLDEHNRAHALAPTLVDAELEAKKCPACGDASGDCRDTDNQHAYVVTVSRCYRTRALQEAQRSPKWKNDPDFGSLLWHVALDPTRKKSAMKKEARKRG